MKRITTSLALTLALAVTSCKKASEETTDTGTEAKTPTPEVKSTPEISEHEQLANQFTDSMKDLATAASSVKDLESANAAASKIEEIGDRFATIASKLETLEPPSDEVKQAITKKMEAREAEMEKAMGEDLQKTLGKASPEAQQVIMEAMMGLFEKMDSVSEVFEEHFGEME